MFQSRGYRSLQGPGPGCRSPHACPGAACTGVKYSGRSRAT